jgi:hypothetical protein
MKEASLRLTSALKFFWLLFLLSVPAAISSGLDNIQADFDVGRISITEKLTLEALMLTDPASLPPRYRPERPLKDGTLLILDIRSNWQEADEDFKNRFSFLLTRIDTQAFFDSPSGFFRIHYDTTGSDAVYQPGVDIDPADGIPDFVNRTAEYFDYAWFRICDTLGYDTPPFDGDRGGGVDLYDVYMHRYAGAYGVTFLEFPSDQRPGRNYDYTSYIYVDPTYDGFGYNDRTLPMKVTSAHEFFHAVQFAYNAQAGGWYMENCSTWMEDILWDDINDNYAYLYYFLNFPHLHLTLTNGAHEYGGFIWPEFLYENWGHEFILSSWNYTIYNNAYTALEYTCEDYGTFLENQYVLFSLWNYLTDYRDDGEHYEEGGSYIAARTMRTHTDYPVYNMRSISRPTALGCNYILFANENHEGNLRLTFDGDDDMIWHLQVIKAYTDDSHVYDIFEIDWDNYGQYLVEDFGQYSWVALIADLVWGSTGDYEYSAVLEPTSVSDEPISPPSSLELLGNYPNPFNSSTVISLDSPREQTVNLKVFDLLGAKVCEKDIGLIPGSNSVTLDFGGLGQPASGVYIYRITSSENSFTGKMLFIK